MRSEPLITRHDLRAALALLTRLPIAGDHEMLANRVAASAWLWPFIGLAVGAFAGGTGVLALVLGLPAGLAAVLALSMQILLTGALHEDGLADCADGFWGGATRDRRLEIMRDSRLGSYGVLALILVGLGRWSAVSALDGWVLVASMGAAGAVSRGLMAAVMAWLPNARSGGLSDMAGRPSRIVSLAALIAASVIAAAAMGLPGLAMFLAGLVAAGSVAAIALARLGGQTGDVLGASQQLAELAALAVAAALLR